MAAHAGEQAWKTGTFKCQSCNAEVRVRKGRKIPKCPNGHSTFDERLDEPRAERPLRGHPRRKSSSRTKKSSGRVAVLGPAVRDRSGVRAPVHQAEARAAVALARVRYLLRKPRTRASGATLRCVDRRLPAPGLQHVRFIKGAYCETLHRTLQVLAYFK